MNLDRQLKTIQQNRAKAERTETLRDPLRRWLDSLAPSVDVRRFYDSMNPADEREFRQYCRIDGVSGDALVIHVSHPSLVAAMRARWQGELRGALNGAVQRVRFTCAGSSGEAAVGNDEAHPPRHTANRQ